MNRPWRRLALVGAASLLVLAGLLAARTSQLESRQPAALPVAALAAAESDHLAEALAGALRLPTVAGDGPFAADAATFLALHDHLRSAFPRVAAALTWEVVAERSLLLTWAGTRPELPAVAFLAHLDVVPAADADGWQHPPFSGDISGGEIWGRGALDDKASLVGLLAAVERLLRAGFVPDRTLLLAFGADEEVAGRGAQALAAAIEHRGLRLASVLDEGTFIVDGVVPGVTQPVALIGTAEKGYASFELAVEGSGGHSSMPPAPSIAAVLGAALARLDAKPMPAHLRSPTRDMLATLAPAMSLTNRVLLANLWLFGPAVERVLGGSP